MKTNYILIDYENVQAISPELLNSETFRSWVFPGPEINKSYVKVEDRRVTYMPADVSVPKP